LPRRYRPIQSGVSIVRQFGLPPGFFFTRRPMILPKTRGLVAAPFTPFQPDGSLHLEAIAPYARHLREVGVVGAFICGTTGEGASLTAAERRLVAERWVAVAPAVRVPRAGTRTARPVGVVDLFPTLNELCGLPAVAGLDGLSLVPLLRDPQRAWDRPALTTHGAGNHTVRSECWRYIRYADGGEALYDHVGAGGDRALHGYMACHHEHES
jgi:hypothetical protein